MCTKRCSFAFFSIDAVEFQSFNDKHLTRVREVCIVLEYNKAARQIISITVAVKMFCMSINFVVESTVDTTINLPRVSKKSRSVDKRKRGASALVFSQQTQAKEFKKLCCSTYLTTSD